MVKEQIHQVILVTQQQHNIEVDKNTNSVSLAKGYVNPGMPHKLPGWKQNHV